MTNGVGERPTEFFLFTVPQINLKLFLKKELSNIHLIFIVLLFLMIVHFLFFASAMARSKYHVVASQ